MEVKLNDYEKRLLDIHSGMYPFVHYGIMGGGIWYIESPDYDEKFRTYEAFINFIETEVKEALLNYALNGELGEVADL